VKKIYFLLILVVLVSSCKTVRINKQPQRIASSAIEFGTIGELNSNLEINAFQTNAIPKYQEKIRVQVAIVLHNKSTFNALKKASKLQGKNVAIKFIDSLANKPKYVSFQLIDYVSIVTQLNSEKNSSIIEHLKIAPKSRLVTTISINFSNPLLKSIESAEEIYLVNNKHKKYGLALYKSNKLYKTIELTSSTIFAYKLSSFCWTLNKRKEPILINVISENLECKNKTYSSYQKALPKEQKVKF